MYLVPNLDEDGSNLHTNETSSDHYHATRTPQPINDSLGVARVA
jgi:hypothetical protein